MNRPCVRLFGRLRVPARGATLLELLVALSLSSVVLLSLAGLMRTTIRATSLHDGLLESQQALRRAIERVAEELRWAESVLPDAACGPSGLCLDRVQVRIPSGNPYRQDRAYDVLFRHNRAQREVERRVGVGVTNVAAWIDSMTLTYYDRTGQPATDAPAVTRIRIELVARVRNGPPRAIGSEVGLRNHYVPLPAPSAADTSATPGWRGPSLFQPPAPPDPPGLPIDPLEASRPEMLR